ncbi:MAG TPA: GNAT family N-acetyltransferase [Ensifer sp.]|uniref:GNAT family N-acetyltransferase n=1 Tax=Ensifer sp. TaxID=1872086 RepID=UPI002E160537|nr:GNAT family N-acetyltransferase [Ensifer sp.]
MSNVRAMEPRDIPAVSGMFNRIFRKRTHEASEELRQYIETTFFGSPLYSPENGSIVYDDGAGSIGSAILALPMEFTVNGRRTVAKLLCAFMSEGKAGAVGAACLARAMRATRQDMCFSDNSSPVSADHWVAGGGIVLPIQSLDWRRSFRPFKAWALTVGRHARILRSPVVTGPLALFDGFLRQRRPKTKPGAAAGCTTHAIDPAAFVGLAEPMLQRFSVRPVWSPAEFEWLLSVAALNKPLGDLLCREVREESGRVIGAYLYFGKARETATVLNIVCAAGREFDVTKQMFHALDAEGYALAVGSAQPFLMNAISRQRWLSFHHRGYFCMVTRHGDLKEAALRNDIYVGGLASESWSRLLTDF